MFRDKNLSNVYFFPIVLQHIFFTVKAHYFCTQRRSLLLIFFFPKRHERRKEILGNQRWSSDIIERGESCFSWGGSLPAGETVSRKSEKSDVCPQRWSNRFQNFLTEKYIFFSCSKRNYVYLLTPILSFKCLPLPSH